MKKTILILSLVVCISFSINLFCYANKNFTHIKNPSIQESIKTLVDTDGEWAIRAINGYNITNAPINIVFKNLSKISKNLTDHNAIGWQNDDETLTIFINSKHKNAPIYALAPLIAHESIHQDIFNSIQEEIYAWTYEAEVWIQIKEKFPHLKTIPKGKYSLVDRENELERLFREANYSSKLIEEKIRGNISYKNLPETSPGFGI